MRFLLVVGVVLGLAVVLACCVAAGLAVRGARAHRHGQERSDLAGAPERLARRDLPELPTRRINIQERS